MTFLALDFRNEETWQGTTGDASRLLLFEQENYKDEPALAELIRIANPAATSASDRPGWYKHQIGMNPDSTLGIRQNFIENNVLSGALTAQEGKTGTQDVLGTLNLPLTRAMPVLARNILQSRNTTDGTITRDPATISGTGNARGKLTADVFATAPALQSSSTKTINAAFVTELNAKTYPVKLEIEIDGQDITDVPATNATGGGIVTIIGTDHWDNPIQDDVFISRVSADDTDKDRTNGNAIAVNHYWKTITSTDTSGFASTTGGTFQIKAYDTAQKVTFKPYDGIMSSYLLASLDIGNVPSFLRGVYAAAANIIVNAQDELVELRIGVGGRTGAERQRVTPDYYDDSGTIRYSGQTGYNASGQTVVPQVVPDWDVNWSDAEKAAFWDTDYRVRQPDNVEIITGPVMDTNRVELKIGATGIRIPITTLNFDFGINFEPSPILRGDPSENPPPGRRRRNPIMSGSYVYSLTDGLGVAAINNIKADFLDLVFKEQGSGAFPDEQMIRIRKTQFQEIGTPPASAGDVLRTYAMLGLPSTPGVSDDVIWEMVLPDYQDVRNY